MDKISKIVDLTRNKTKNFSVMLNEELVELFKQACDKNNTRQTHVIETFIIEYVDKAGLLD